MPRLRVQQSQPTSSERMEAERSACPREPPGSHGAGDSPGNPPCSSPEWAQPRASPEEQPGRSPQMALFRHQAWEGEPAACCAHAWGPFQGRAEVGLVP